MMEPTPYKTFDGKVTIRGTVYVEIPGVAWEEWSDLGEPVPNTDLEEVIASALAKWLQCPQHLLTVEARDVEVIKQ